MTTAAIAERYTLVREVGRGGMGAVWLGEDLLLHRQVALKRIGFAPAGPAGEASGLVRAEREARLAAMINHPHVVAVYDLVDEDDRQWLVMEYVDGVALSSLLDAEGPLGGDRAAAMIAQAADALAAAHAAGVVHRDVKPSNLLVATGNQVKISDFGIARGEEDASLTRTGMVTGSPAYLAPEVASGASATAASDVWSLGATLFHAVTGRTPYAVGDNVLGTLYRIVNEEPPRLPAGHPLGLLLQHTMATDPAARWSMTEVRDYLHGDGPPVAVLHGPQTTQAMAPPVAAPSFLESATRRDPRPPVPTPSTQASRRGTTHAARRERAWLLPAATVLLAVLLVAVIGLGFGLLSGDGDDDSSPGTTAGSSAPSPAPDSGSPGPSETPEESEESEGADAQAMESFVESYLGTVVNEPRTAFDRLTPAFQRESGGFAGYDSFWSDYASASVASIDADPEALTVSYTVDYVLESGDETSDEVTLQLTYDDGAYLIAGES